MDQNIKAIGGPPSGKRSPIPQLDTIRVVAMLGIFLHHLWKTVIPSPQGLAQNILDPVFDSASDGVILFNIISGFLIALPYLGAERRPFSGYPAFLRKRFLRILPPYYIALLCFTAANILHFGYHVPAAMDLLLQHVLFVNSLNYSNMLTNFSHFWYLGQLAQFYLLFPFILPIFQRIGPMMAAVSLCALCWGGWLLVGVPQIPESYPSFAENLMHFNLPGRLPEFAVGMWLASIWDPSAGSRYRRIFDTGFSVFSGAMVLYLVVGAAFLSAMNIAFLHVYHVALSLVLFLFLLMWAPAQKAGKTFLVRNIAAHSYSIYIVHHPIFSYAGVMPSTVTHSIGNFVLLAVLVFPLCWLAALVLDLLSFLLADKFSKAGKGP